jgi:Zn-dependent M28 family amino/carboxypeptidase
VLVAAHYDHVGTGHGGIYRGADDNAAAVAILVDVARRLRGRRGKRSVLFAAFDAEEPPNFLGDTMGSQYFVDHPLVPLGSIDLMVCLDLVGHSLGPVGTPSAVRETVFALGAERSSGTAAHVDALARAVPGVVIRRVDAEAIPPLSDYFAFWQRRVPFLFLSNGRSAVYHTPEDTPDKLDFGKMQATSRWLARFVSETRDRPEARFEWRADIRDDASTLRTLAAIAREMSAVDPAATGPAQAAESLLGRCDEDGRLPERHRGQLAQLTAMMESGLA